MKFSSHKEISPLVVLYGFEQAQKTGFRHNSSSTGTYGFQFLPAVLG